MSTVLDAGALIAIEQRDRRIAALLLVAQRNRIHLVTSSAVVAQVWRGGDSTQANLARQLPGITERPLTPADARAVGTLLGLDGSADIADAHVALITNPGDTVHTSDADDIARLLAARGVRATVARV